MDYKYLVLCWVPPKSGFELMTKHTIIENLRKELKENVIDEKSDLIQHIDSFINNFISEYNGLVIDMIPMESNEIITDPEKQLLPEIKKNIPDAELIFCINISDVVSTPID